MKTKTINTVDLFCGAGGATTGLEMALDRLGLRHSGLAINHWKIAVDTMKANHPSVDTLQMSIEEAVPADLVPGGRVDFLWASPSCTHHSRAKGGKPRDNQLRAQPELILTWLDQLFVKRLCVENVPEFVDWGPLSADKRPLESKKGACFQAWITALKARNYIVEWKILNCANYGDATTRRRFFLQAVRRGCGRITWPAPTHSEKPDLFLKPWRGIRECLDLSDLGRSIFEPGRNLSMNTLRRVDVGMRKFNGFSFLMDMFGAGDGDDSRVHSLDNPMPVQHAGGNRCAVVRPFIVRMNRNCDAEEIDLPLSTTTTKEHHALCTPFIVKMNHNANAEDIEKPLTSVLAGGQHHALCTPFIVRSNKGCFAESVEKPLSSEQAHTVHHALCQPIIIDHFKNGDAHNLDEPLGAQTTHDRYSVVTPFLVTEQANNAPRSIDAPLRSQTTVRKDYLCTPLILGQQGGARCRPIDEPCPTIATAGAIRLATPVILDMSRPSGNDSGHIGSADAPIRTITTYDNMQVAMPVIFDTAVGLPRLPDGRYIDIFLRMLKPSELAAAHSFPSDYKLTGTRSDQVKQIGNSVPCRTAAAICESALSSLSA